MAKELRVVEAGQREEESDPPVPGLHRERAYGEGGYWAGVVRVEPGMETQWHHHGDYDTFIYTRAGAFRFETADGTVTEGEGEGTFVFIPKGLVHRELNPGDAEGVAVLVRAGGSGPAVVPVDPPR